MGAGAGISASGGVSGSLLMGLLGLLSGEISVDGGGNYSSNSHGNITVRDIQDRLREVDARVEWNGEKFVIKPTTVSRINLSKLKAGSSIGIVNVQVNSYETVHEIPVKVGTMSDPTSVLSPQLVEKRLQEKIENALMRKMTEENN